MSRRRRATVGVPVAIVLIATGLKLLSLGFFAGRGATAVAAGDGGVAIDEYRRLTTLNLVESWKAPYNAGVAYFVDGSYATAEDRFRQALDEADRCDIRINLALALEAQGDDDAETAAADYLLGIEAVSADTCRDGPLAGAASEVALRLAAKLDADPETTVPPVPPAPSPTTPDSVSPTTGPPAPETTSAAPAGPEQAEPSSATTVPGDEATPGAGSAPSAVSAEQLDMLDAKSAAAESEQRQYEEWDEGDDLPERDFDEPAW